MKKVISKSREETSALAETFVSEHLSNPGVGATIIALRGDLGSGKTTFVQALAKAMGVALTVSSPTFVIQKSYETKHFVFHKLFHIDAYRLKTGSELLFLRFEEISKDPSNLILIEWPERVKDVLPGDTKDVSFKFISENEREIDL